MKDTIDIMLRLNKFSYYEIKKKQIVYYLGSTPGYRKQVTFLRCEVERYRIVKPAHHRLQIVAWLLSAVTFSNC